VDLEVSKNDLVLLPKKQKNSSKITIYPFWKDIWKVQVSWINISLLYYYPNFHVFLTRSAKALQENH
jgi:hypothetical protein